MAALADLGVGQPWGEARGRTQIIQSGVASGGGHGHQVAEQIGGSRVGSRLLSVDVSWGLSARPVAGRADKGWPGWCVSYRAATAT
jgi:hypothetical protein